MFLGDPGFLRLRTAFAGFVGFIGFIGLSYIAYFLKISLRTGHPQKESPPIE
jgi:hypothetical protein